MIGSVLVVDDEPAIVKLCLAALHAAGHSARGISDPTVVRAAVAEQEFQVVVTDLSMPGMNGLQVIDIVRKHVPRAEVIIMTGQATVETAVEAMRRGASDYLIKPFSSDQFVVAVEKAIRVYSYRSQLIGVRRIIKGFSTLLEARDPYTAGHQHRVGRLAAGMARIMGLPPETRELLYLGGLIHDIGKIAVPTEILNKPTRLNTAEMNIIKSHVKVGYDVLRNIPLPPAVAAMESQHHERLDGSGYPLGIGSESIIREARIIAVADVVEAMSSHRPYRPALGIEAAESEIRGRSGTAYDPLCVETCIELMHEADFPHNLNDDPEEPAEMFPASDSTAGTPPALRCAAA